MFIAFGDEAPSFPSNAEAVEYWRWKAGEFKKAADAAKKELDDDPVYLSGPDEETAGRTVQRM